MTQTVGGGGMTTLTTATFDSGYHGVAANDGEAIEYGWIAHCAELPGCTTDGRTAEDALASLDALIPDFIGLLREDGLHVPAPNEHLGKERWTHEDAYGDKD